VPNPNRAAAVVVGHFKRQTQVFAARRRQPRVLANFLEQTFEAWLLEPVRVAASLRLAVQRDAEGLPHRRHLVGQQDAVQQLRLLPRLAGQRHAEGAFAAVRKARAHGPAAAVGGRGGALPLFPRGGHVLLVGAAFGRPEPAPLHELGQGLHEREAKQEARKIEMGKTKKRNERRKSYRYK
jgi:hypothetical protein